MCECPLICRVILVYYKLRLEKRFVNGIDEKAVNSIYVFFFSLFAPVDVDVSYAQSHFLLSLF